MKLLLSATIGWRPSGGNGASDRHDHAVAVAAAANQDRIRQEWLKLRLERVLPELMRRHGVAMWSSSAASTTKTRSSSPSCRLR